MGSPCPRNNRTFAIQMITSFALQVDGRHVRAEQIHVRDLKMASVQRSGDLDKGCAQLGLQMGRRSQSLRPPLQ
jgi:hypothetical protein